MDILMTKQEAAAYLRTSVRTLDRLLRKHHINRFWVGGTIRVHKHDIEKLITTDDKDNPNG
jgi:excisionase family DNA binding protein